MVTRYLSDVLRLLSDAGWFREGLQPNDPLGLARKGVHDKLLDKAELLDVIEYHRAIHGEMAALMSALTQGVDTRLATLYVTTFPCATCARHVVAAGIMRVVYVEAFPKSKVEQLHADSIAVNEAHTGVGERVTIEPFVGISNRRMEQLFSWVKKKQWDLKEGQPLDGTLVDWSLLTASIRESIILKDDRIWAVTAEVIKKHERYELAHLEAALAKAAKKKESR